MSVEKHSPIPYVGPRPFERQEKNLFFGRDREVSELLSLIISHRTVLLYAQSGAGKTSLINASLIPQLEGEMFKVLPIARVKGLIPENLNSNDISNLYIFNTLQSWIDKDFNLKRLVRTTIKDFLKEFKFTIEDIPLPTPHVIIFDQFEDLFSAFQERWEDREEFFRQVADALHADPLLRVMFVIREDYIAQLEPYTHLLPEKLRTQYRLQCLKRNAALSAVKGPLKESHRSFKKGVAETLVEDLLKIRVETLDSGTTIVSGEFIEPVQLQVVCQSLWEALPSEATIITEEDLQSFGDVNQALQEFYENCIEKTIQQTNVEEGLLRSWFKNTLITPSGTRGTAYRGKEETGGIPNTSVDVLESLHLIRGEFRGGARWYELTHDRFIEPILKSNQEWLSKHVEGEQVRQLLEARASDWVASGSGKKGLLSEIELIEAERWLKSARLSDQKFSESVLAFVQASRAEQERQRAEVEKRSARRLRRMVVALTGVAVLIFALAYMFFMQRGKAIRAQKLAEVQKQVAEQNEEKAVRESATADSLRKEFQMQAKLAKRSEADAKRAETVARDARMRAEEQREIAEKEKIKADSLRKEAIDQRKNALEQKAEAEAAKNEIDRLYQLGSIALVLANETQRQKQMGEYEIAALLARQAYLFDDTEGKTFQNEVFKALRTILNSEKTGIDKRIGGPNFLTGHNSWVRSVVFQPNGNKLASCSNDGTVRLWTFQQDQDSSIRIDKIDAKIRALAFSHDGQTLAYGCDDHKILLKNLDNLNSPSQVLLGHKGGVWAITFIPDKSKIFSAGADSMIMLWDLDRQPPDTMLSIKHNSRIKTMVFTPSRQILFIGDDMGFIQPFHFFDDFKKYRKLKSEHAHKESINSLALSITGDTLASCGFDETVKLWKVNYQTMSYEWTKTLHGHEGPVNTLAFSSEKNFLASGSSDRTVRLWDLQNLNNRPIVLENHDRWVLTIAFNSRGDTLVAGTGKETIYIWPTSSKSLANEICNTVSRNLTWEEWKELVGENIEYECTCKEFPPPLDLPYSIRVKLKFEK
jgi:WD40 repeat protein